MNGPAPDPRQSQLGQSQPGQSPSGQDQPKQGQPSSAWPLVVRCELLRLSRDRRALFIAVVLPILLYPVLLWGSGKLNAVTEQQIESTVVRAEVDLTRLPETVATRVRAALLEGPEPLELEAADLTELIDLDTEEARLVVRERLSGGEELAVTILGKPTANGPPELLIFERGSDERGQAGGERARDALRSLREEGLVARLTERLGADPAAGYESEIVDHVRPKDATGASLARFLPWIAVLILISAGSFAALDAFAAERELGTLETLLVQPIRAIEIARGKFLSVLLIGLLAWIGNGLSLIACAAFGLLDRVGHGTVTAFEPALIGRVALGTLVFLPSSVLVSVLLCWFSSRAKSFREGQQALLPLTLGSLALVAPSAAADLELNALWALVPLTGPALCLRDALLGRLDLWLAALSFGASLVPAWLMLGRLGDTLDAERLLQGDAPKGERRARSLVVKRSAWVAFAAALANYLIGSRLQGFDLVGGLLATLWGLFLGIAVVLAWRNARDEQSSLAAELGLRSASPLAFLSAAGAALGLAHLAPKFSELQAKFLKQPALEADAMAEALSGLESLSPLALIALLALSPGICEELLFRGSVLSGLLRDRSRALALFLSAAAFALSHVSVFRLPITFLIGLVLGGFRIRAASLLPCILLHVTYNGLLVGRSLEASFSEQIGSTLASPWCLLGLIPGILWLGFGFLHRPKSQPSDTVTSRSE